MVSRQMPEKVFLLLSSVDF